MHHLANYFKSANTFLNVRIHSVNVMRTADCTHSVHVLFFCLACALSCPFLTWRCTIWMLSRFLSSSYHLRSFFFKHLIWCIGTTVCSLSMYLFWHTHIQLYVQMFTIHFNIMVGHNKMLHPYRSHLFMDQNSTTPLQSCLFLDLVVMILVCSLHHHFCFLIWWICSFCWLVKSAPSDLHLIMAMDQPTLMFSSLFFHIMLVFCHLLY